MRHFRHDHSCGTQLCSPLHCPDGMVRSLSRQALSFVDQGYRVLAPETRDANNRPLCCGRTYLTCGMVDEARAEATRLVNTLAPYAAKGIPIVGLEPSCLLSLRDEISVLLASVDCLLKRAPGGRVGGIRQFARVRIHGRFGLLPVALDVFPRNPLRAIANAPGRVVNNTV